MTKTLWSTLLRYHWRFKCSVLFIILYITSFSLPVLGSSPSISFDNMPLLELAVASVLFALSLLISLLRRKRKIKSKSMVISAYRMLFTFPMILLCLYLIQIEIEWDILLIGIAWRLWLLTFILEDLIDSIRRRRRYKISSTSPVFFAKS